MSYEAETASTETKNSKKEFDKEKLANTVGLMIDEARGFIFENLEPDRETATNYYKGRPFGDEVDGRSKVVIPEVRNTVQNMLPDLMRLFCGSERYVEIRPQPSDDPEQVKYRIKLARQQTDTINYVIMEDNPGFEVILSSFTDAMVRWTGFISWAWEDKEEIEGKEYSGLSVDQLRSLLAEEDAEVEVTEGPYTVVQGGEPYFNAKVTRTKKVGRVIVEAVPPEEVAWNRTARNFRDARIVVRSRERRKDDLIAMGYNPELLENAVGELYLADESQGTASARRFDSGQGAEGEDMQDDATRPVVYHEAYVYAIGDEKDAEKGVASLWKICGITGSEDDENDAVTSGGFVILSQKRVDHRPIAVLVPKPEPHTIVGGSVYDDTADLQRIQSRLWRGTLDSMGLAIDPRLGILEGAVNPADLQNNETGGFIRMKVLDAVREIKHSFVGAATLPLMEALKDERAERTGQTKQSAGLDADAMQSTTKQAVTSTLQKGQRSIEFMARIFAESMKEVYRGIYLTLIEHQDFARILDIRGEYVEIDPRDWGKTCDVKVNVALGAGLQEDRMNSLREIGQNQAEIIQMYGPVNPLVKMSHLRNTLARMIEMAGWPTADEFISRIDEEQEQQLAAAAANPQQPPADPVAMAQAQAAIAKVQIEGQRAQAEAASKQQELALRARELDLEDARERQRISADIALRFAEMQMEHGHATDKVALDAMIARERAALDAATAVSKHEKDAQTKVEVAHINADAKKASAKSAPVNS